MTLALTRPAPAPEWSPMSTPAPGFDVPAAFAEHGSALLGFAVNALRDRSLAEDCVQETFLRAWRSRDSFDRALGSERTWLFTIQRRVVLDAFRAQARRPRLVEHDEQLDGPAPAPTDPLERLGIVEGLARLSAEHREAVVAVHLTGLSYQEFSAATGVPVATLRTRVFYALRALRSHLDEGDQTDA
jgi:RNA polymerase sigma-70 factor (ECF subfamily)